jgi:hypothetical protein
MSADENGPCIHCMFAGTLKMLITMFPKKECRIITQELVELLAEYVASTAPAGECESAIKICQEKLAEMTRNTRAEFVKSGLVVEATVQ